MTLELPGQPSRLETLFEKALDVPHSMRPDFLIEACPDDPELRRRVLLMLEQDDQGTKEYLLGPLSDQVEADQTDELSRPFRQGEADPKSVGDFTIERHLGEGGMGRVFLASRDENPERRVAIKVMRPGAHVGRVVRRFEHERRFLAAMEHENVCAIVGSGRTEEGLPYFVMEYVEEARSLTRHAREEQLDREARLRLFLPICAAVAHGHDKGVLHRDLKPSNILVGRDGVPKLIDFGIARHFDTPEDTVSITESGQLIGTLQYMAPEQVKGGALDERCDVYSLGVLLYELVVRHLPYDVTGKPLVEAGRIIQETRPTRPSSLDPTLKGDLETILMKALEKEPARRYANVRELAEDLVRFLGSKPIQARPPGLVYQARLFTRRHRGLAAGLALSFGTLVLGVIASSFWAVRAERATKDARRAADEAEQARHDAEAITDFLTRSLAQVDPRRTSKVPTVDLLVDSMIARMAGRFTHEPRIQGQLLATLGATLEALGLLDRAHGLLTEGHRLLAEAYGPDDPRTLRARVDLSVVDITRGHDQRVVQSLIDELPFLRRILGEDDPTLHKVLFTLGWEEMLNGLYVPAETFFQEALAGRTRVFGPEDMRTLEVRDALAGLYSDMGRVPEAEAMLSEIMAIQERVLGGANAETLNTLGLLYFDVGRYEEAERRFEEAIAKQEQALGVDHPDLLITMYNLALLFLETDRLEDADGLLAEVVERQHVALGSTHPQTLEAMATLGTVRLFRGSHGEAAELLSEAAEGLADVPEAREQLGHVLARLGEAFLELELLDEAEDAFLRAYGILREAETEPIIETPYVAETLAELYGDLGRPGQAEEWRVVAASFPREEDG